MSEAMPCRRGNTRSFIDRMMRLSKSSERVSWRPIICRPCSGSPSKGTTNDWVNRSIKKNSVSFREIPKFPAVSRDLALLVDKQVEFGQIEAIAYQSEKKLLKAVSLFDVYEGKNLEDGKKSYAVNFILQDESKTLNDKAIDAVMNKIIQNLQKQLDAKLR